MEYPTGVRIGMYGAGELCIFAHRRDSGVNLHTAYGKQHLANYTPTVELTQEEVEKVLTVIKDILKEKLDGKH